MTYIWRTYLVWRTWELPYLGVVVVVAVVVDYEINVVGGWCCCTHLFLVGINLLRTYHTCLAWHTWELSYLGVVVVDEINVGGGWCCRAHFFRAGTNLLHTYHTCLVWRT